MYIVPFVVEDILDAVEEDFKADGIAGCFGCFLIVPPSGLSQLNPCSVFLSLVLPELTEAWLTDAMDFSVWELCL